MANANSPFGFRVSRHVAGGTPSRGNAYGIASGYNTSLFSGDLVKTTGDNTIEKATAGDAIIGVFNGVEWTDPDGSIRYERMWTGNQSTQAAAKATAYVLDDPSMLFEAQTSGTINDAEVGQLVNLVDGTGDSQTGQSRQTVNAGGGSENQFRVERILEIPMRKASGNPGISEAGQYAVVELKAANHELGGAATAIER